MRIFLLSIIIILLGFGVVHADDITVSHFDGGWDNDTKVTPGRQVTWYVHWNTIPHEIMAFTNGFRVYLSDQIDGSNILNPGPGFTPITYEILMQDFDSDCVSFSVIYYVVDGIGADTIGFGAVDCWPSIFIDEDVWSITTQVENIAIGNYLCIDSSFFPPGGAWLWSTEFSGTIKPSWDGPHCYLIEDCCQGIRGDVNADTQVLVDDLTNLVDYLFKGGQSPDCLKAGDVVIDGDILVDDLSFLVNYLFKSGDTPPQCD
jgi:hypothetical protein